MNVFAVLFGVPVWGFALLWIVLATELTVRTLRRGMPFALTWWSLTFPVGTFVTGTTQLANHTGLPAFRWPPPSPTSPSWARGGWSPCRPHAAASAEACSSRRRQPGRSRPKRIRRRTRRN